MVDQKFVLRISHPENNLAAVAPSLGAGITTHSPLRQWKVGPGQKVGVVGLGGLGHMAVKIANAMCAHVVLFTTSPDKKEDALRLGASVAHQSGVRQLLHNGRHPGLSSLPMSR